MTRQAFFIAIVALSLLMGAHADLIPYTNCSAVVPPHLQVSTLSLLPNPAVAGYPATLNITGVTDSKLTNGTANVVVIFMGAVVLNKTGDMCQMNWMQCPVTAGPVLVQHVFYLPSFLAAGDFTFKLNITAPDGSTILCMSFVLPVTRPSSTGLLPDPAQPASASKVNQLFDLSAVSKEAVFAPAAASESESARVSIPINDEAAALAGAEAEAAGVADLEAAGKETASESATTAPESSEAGVVAESPVGEEAAAISESAAAPAESGEASEATEAVSAESADPSASEASILAAEMTAAPSIPAAELSEHPSAQSEPKKAHKKKTAQLMREARLLEDEFDSIAEEVDRAAHDLDHGHPKAKAKTGPRVTLVLHEDAGSEVLPALPALLKQVQEALVKGDISLLPSSPASPVTIPLSQSAREPSPTSGPSSGPGSASSVWPWTHGQDWELGNVEWTGLDKEAADTARPHSQLAEIHKRYSGSSPDSDDDMADALNSNRLVKAAVADSDTATFPFSYVASVDSDGGVTGGEPDSTGETHFFFPSVVRVFPPGSDDHTPEQHDDGATVFPFVAGDQDSKMRDYFAEAFSHIAKALQHLPSSAPELQDPQERLHADNEPEPETETPDDNPRGLAFPFPPSFRFGN